MSINQRYIDLSIAYLSVLQEEEIILTKFKGNDAYIFSCPFCAHNYQHQANPKKSGHLIRTGGDTWKFICTKGGSRECNRRYAGERSLYNFLAMLNRTIFDHYKKDLADNSIKLKWSVHPSGVVSLTSEQDPDA